MLARGYNGTIIDLYKPTVVQRDWLIALVLPVLAITIMTIAWVRL